MPNPRTPNSQSDIDRFTQGVEKTVSRIGRSSVRDVLGTAGDRLSDKAVILKELVNNVDNPILKGMAMDTITIMSNWFEDPSVLCCVIHGLWTTYAAGTNFKDKTISLADTDFSKWLDTLIALVDLVIVFLGNDVKKISIFIPDIIKEITNGVIGGILLVLQEILFAMKDSVLSYLLAEVGRGIDRDRIWAKCLPFDQFLGVLKRYIHDYGLFAELFEKIKGFVGGKTSAFKLNKKANFPQNVRDLEFLFWYRDLLIKLKDATINLDLCVNWGTAPSGGAVSDDDVATGIPKKAPTGNEDILNATQRTTRPDPSAVQGLKIASDGTILQDKEKLKDDSVPILTNSSIRTFLNKYYGYPLDVIDNLITTSSSAESVQGTDINSSRPSDLNADCLNAPTQEEMLRWALRIRNRNL